MASIQLSKIVWAKGLTAKKKQSKLMKFAIRLIACRAITLLLQRNCRIFPTLIPRNHRYRTLKNPHQDVALGTPSIRAVPGEVYANHFTSQCNTEVSFSFADELLSSANTILKNFKVYKLTNKCFERTSNMSNMCSYPFRRKY